VKLERKESWVIAVAQRMKGIGNGEKREGEKRWVKKSR